jgi:hypothetical protein
MYHMMREDRGLGLGVRSAARARSDTGRQGGLEAGASSASRVNLACKYATQDDTPVDRPVVVVRSGLLAVQARPRNPRGPPPPPPGGGVRPLSSFRFRVRTPRHLSRLHRRDADGFARCILPCTYLSRIALTPVPRESATGRSARTLGAGGRRRLVHAGPETARRGLYYTRGAYAIRVTSCFAAMLLYTTSQLSPAPRSLSGPIDRRQRREWWGRPEP